jgi:glycosyltransferase involved in cell wall biosynthesis
MRLIVVTQSVDPGDPVLGATVAKITALAGRVDEVVVLADRAVPGALPSNCRVRLFGSRSRVGRGVRFGAALLSELRRRPRPAAVLAHMCPIYAVLAAPVARPLGTRVMLWYAHWNRTRTLDLAVRLSNVVTSVDERSVPVRSAKVAGIGHGIEVADFTCAEPPSGPPRAIALGRYSAAKGLETIVRAVALARGRGLDARLACHGTAGHPGEREHLRQLRALVEALGVGDAVTLGPPLPRTEIPALLASSSVLVNNMRPGAPDKVVYEACAACRPVLVSNPSFAELLDGVDPALRFPLDDAEALADAFEHVARLSVDEATAIGQRLRERVVARHSVDSWADAIVRLASGQPPSART